MSSRPATSVRIDPSTWEVHLLPHPARFTRSKALGFCQGRPVGMAERARGSAAACWWPDGAAELLVLDGRKELQVLGARGARIAGSWAKGTTGAQGAVSWSPGPEGVLVGRDLHDARFERSWAEQAESDLVLGVGVPRGRMSERGPDVGLVWHADGSVDEVHGVRDVCLRGTNGRGLVGHVGGRAAWWPSLDASPVDLHPAELAASEATAVCDDMQVGIVFRGMTARAATWQGTAASFRDITPKGFEVGRAMHAAGGLIAGLVRRKDVTRNGSSNLADQAVVWTDEDGWTDLNALLPSQSGLNASVAWCLDVQPDRVLVCGEASRYEVDGAGTKSESHFLPAAQAVLWTVRRSA